ncbi:hypothetical protein LTR85_005078 [Meristemomyces frigidus]|nr:hypothetical protein LTR85_005078 [Meristemomyces frigidus]
MAPSLHFALLQPRFGLSDTSNITCAHSLTNDVGKPLVGSLTFHQLMILISAACLGLTVISSVLLSWRHLHSYTAPQEQRQILRIVNIPVFYCLFNFLALCFYQQYQEIEPIAGIYEAFTVASLFLLVLEYVTPDGTDREKYFDQLEGLDKKNQPVPGGSLKWFQRTWSSTMQYPLTKSVFVVVQIITQQFHVYCESSWSPKYAHVWLLIADILFIGGALGATVKFYQRMKTEVNTVHRCQAKVYSFIGIVAFQILQGIVFHLLNGKLFNPTATVTYNDINFGIPSLMTCVEAVIFSLMFQWSFSSGEYAESRRVDRLGGNPASRKRTLRAVLDALNLSDIIAGTIVAFQLLFMRVQSRYGARAPPQRERGMKTEEQVGMEPLSERSRMRGYSGESDGNAEYTSPGQTAYDDGMYVPSMPRSARDPSPSGRARTFRADELRPQDGGQEYEPLTRSREPSPSGVPQHYPRQMV